MGAEEGRRERKKRETRAALIGAALRLAVEKGVDVVTVDEIAEAADVSVRTFFNYFPHKELAILGWNPDDMQRALARVREAPAEQSPLTVLRWVIDKALGDLSDRAGDLPKRIELMMRSPSLLSVWVQLNSDDERALAAAMAERMSEPATAMRPNLLVGAATMAVRVAFEKRKQGADRDLTALVDEAFQTFAQGIDPDYDDTVSTGTDQTSNQEGSS